MGREVHKEVRVVLLPVKSLLVLLFIPTKYKSNPLKKVTYNFEKKLTKMLTWDITQGLLPDARPPAHPDVTILKDGVIEKKHQSTRNVPKGLGYPCLKTINANCC